MVVGGFVGSLVVVVGLGCWGNVLLCGGFHGRLQVDGWAVVAVAWGFIQLGRRFHGSGLVVVGVSLGLFVACHWCGSGGVGGLVA